ncbi:MAG TPA: hypothetical protein VMF13_17350 [Luteitalea sp.]|nr:hypothetical protein [Luteitalea sp.]
MSYPKPAHYLIDGRYHRSHSIRSHVKQALERMQFNAGRSTCPRKRGNVSQALGGADACAERPRHRGGRELDVEGALAFAERTLPRAAALWVQAPLTYKQLLHHLFYPDGTRTTPNGSLEPP